MADKNQPPANATGSPQAGPDTKAATAAQPPISPAPAASTAANTGTLPTAPGHPEPAPATNKDTLDTTDTSDPSKTAQPNRISEDIAAANRTPTEARIAEQRRPLRLAARAGWPFSINGRFFGTDKGTVLIGGQAAEVTTWRDHSIKGFVPQNAQSGELVIKLASGEERKGQFVRQQDPAMRF